MIEVLEKFFPSLIFFKREVRESIVNFFIANRNDKLSLTVFVPKTVLILMLQEKGFLVGPQLEMLVNETDSTWLVDIESLDNDVIRLYTPVNSRELGGSSLHSILNLPKKDFSDVRKNAVGFYYDVKNDSIVVKKEYFLVKNPDDTKTYHQFKYSPDGVLIDYTQEILTSDKSAFKDTVGLVKALKEAGIKTTSSYRTDSDQTYLFKSKK